MPVAPSQPSTLYTAPYLTVAEFRNAPTGVDVSSLVPGASSGQRDAELANVIARASGLVNVICGQNLAATSYVEQGRVRLSRRGELYVKTRNWPIIEVTQVLLGSSPSQLTTALDLTELFIESSSFTLLAPSLGLTTNIGPLQLGLSTPEVMAFCRWTYVNGWPVTTLKSATLVNATTLPVVSATGIHTGTTLTIYDGANEETVTVTGEPTGTNVPVSAMAFAHSTVGTSISSLPPAVKEATILMTAALIKVRGNQSLIMRTINAKEPQPKAQSNSAQADVNDAMWMLAPFRAMR